MKYFSIEGLRKVMSKTGLPEEITLPLVGLVGLECTSDSMVMPVPPGVWAISVGCIDRGVFFLYYPMVRDHNCTGGTLYLLFLTRVYPATSQ